MRRVVFNQKGGVGKSSITANLAAISASRGIPTLVVDLDPQGQCAIALNRERERGIYNLLVNEMPLWDVIRTTGRDRLWGIWGDKSTSTALTVLVAKPSIS